MALFHPAVTIDINKSYCIVKYQTKSPEFINDKLRELSNDDTNWSSKVIYKAQEIMRLKKLKFDSDVLIPLRNSSKTTLYQLEKPMDQYTNSELKDKMRNILDSSNIDSNSNNSNTASDTNEIYIGLNSKYKELDDIMMAQLIILLSNIAKDSKRLWVSIILQMEEFKGALFYFLPEVGKITLSERSFDRNKKSKFEYLKDYINAMNDLIEGRRELPF